LDILDAVKMTTQENAASGDFEAAGRSLRSLAPAFQNLSDNRADGLSEHDRPSKRPSRPGSHGRFSRSAIRPTRRP
jgi:hypothetical protein